MNNFYVHTKSNNWLYKYKRSILQLKYGEGLIFLTVLTGNKVNL